MADYDLKTLPKVLQISLELFEYPTLAPAIRKRMRYELFSRGVISPSDFDKEIRHRAMLSQRREGLTDPFAQESEDVWQTRVAHYRDSLTDFYFAHNLPHDLFAEVVRSVLSGRGAPDDVVLTFNPELAPWAWNFSQGEAYEALPPEELARVKHHLDQIKVVLIKGLISDQLAFVGIARDLFTVADLKAIRMRRIGRGKIGGKAAGMMLAWKILNMVESEDGTDLKSHVVLPESYFIGADVFYDFMALNDLHYLHNQKYKSREEIEADYPEVRKAFIGGRFPENIVERVREILDRVGHRPLIVRSSSLLEDNFGTSFAGKYDSFFCPNQGTPKENLEALLLAITKVYGSVHSPDALFYRQRMDLIDYDERMAVMLQEVQGERHGDYFFPTLAGVAFSHNPFRWTPKIHQEDGFLRFVFGLGTRAVDRVAQDYPRMVALSHPGLRPEVDAASIRRYSQRFADTINLAENEFQTLPVRDLLDMDFPAARHLVSVDHGDYLQPPLAYDPSLSPHDLVLTFDNLLTRTQFVPLLKAMLKTLSERFGRHVDVEFTADVVPGYPQPSFVVHLLQCRPQSWRRAETDVAIPTTVAQKDVLFSTDLMVPQGRVQRIRHVVFVDPEAYGKIPDETTRLQIARVVGRLNQALEEKSFILMGPGRWGSGNIELGVKVTYADIFGTAMLIEIGLSHGDSAPEVSYGTHFFQDLVESRIYPLALYPDRAGTSLNWPFLRKSPSVLLDLLPDSAAYEPYVRVIDVAAVSGGRLLEVVMNSNQGQALAYLRPYASQAWR